MTDKSTAWLDTIVAKGRPTTELKWQKVKKPNAHIYWDVAAAARDVPAPPIRSGRRCWGAPPVN
ncbi:MAG: hypothetical protein ACXW3K_06215 [Brevundimonas sp.]